MAEVLPESIAEIDRSRGWFNSGESLTRKKPRRGIEKAINQEFARDTARLELAGKDTPSRRRIADRSGDEDFVARARRVAPQNTTVSLTQERDCNRERVCTRDISADYINPRTSGSLSESCIEPVKERGSQARTHCKVDYAYRWDSTHCGDITQVDC